MVDAVIDDEILDVPQTLRWTKFAICTKRIMVAYIFFLRRFIKIYLQNKGIDMIGITKIFLPKLQNVFRL